MTKNDDKRIPALRFKGFNDDWAQRKLGKLSKIKSGQTPSSHDNSNYYPPQINWIRTGDLTNSKIISVDKLLSKKGAEKLTVFPKNTVVIAMYGGFNQIGRTGLLTFPSTINQALAAISPNPLINSNFLLQLLNKNIYTWRRVAASSRKDPNITKKDIENQKFDFPSVFEQEKISKLISLIDKLITLQQRKLKQYQLIKKWLCSVVFNDTVHDDNNILFSNRVKANQLFESISKKGFKDLPVLSASQEKGMVFRDDISKNITYTNSNLNNYKLVFPGNFVVHLRSFQGGFSYSDKIGIASPAYTIFGFKDNIKYDPIFWKEKFKSYNFIQLLKKVTYGVRDGRSISFSDFLSLYLTFPDIEIQKKIGKCFKALDNQTSDQQCIIQQLKQLKQFLLQNMFI